MKRFMILMLAMLLASVALGFEAQRGDGPDDALNSFEGPNGKRLQELSDQMIELKAADLYDRAIWDEFYGLLYGMNMQKDRAENRANLDQGGEDIATALVIPSLPFTDGGTTSGYANDYHPNCAGSHSSGPDVVYKYTPTKNETIQISLCGSYFDTKLLVYKNSSSDRIACTDDGCPQYRTDQALLPSVSVTTGNTYYIVVDGYGEDCGRYFLRVNVAGCDRLPDGTFQNDDGSFTYRQTTSGSTTDTSLYKGPWNDPTDCTDDHGHTLQTTKGFDYYSAFDQDYGWRHRWPDWNTPGLNVQSVQVIICAYDVDEYSCNLDNPGHPEECELDNIYADGSMQLPTYLSGDNGIDWATTFSLSPSVLLDNGLVDMFIDINVYGPNPATGQCWMTTLYWSQLIVTYSIQQEENHPPYTPTGYGMPCVDDNTMMCATITGPVPPDPDGDDVEYIYEWFVSNIGTGGGFQPDEFNPAHPVNHTTGCVPASDSDIGDTWKVRVSAKDIPHGAQSDYLEITFPVIVYDCGEPPYTDVDMGDLDQCKYPSLVGNPSHGLSGIAWLGNSVTSEAVPHGVNEDLEDGVEFMNPPWTPCFPAVVKVTVTEGSFYHAYADTGGKLYLSAWKDGNLDGDFCDNLCDGQTSEWIIRDKEVTPDSIYTIEVMDPGREDITHYRGVFRFRLTSRRVGPFGFGLVDREACEGMTCGSFAHDFLGEVEDYDMPDFQLGVEMGAFDAIASEGRIALRWNTLSESGNDHFLISRDGSLVAEIRSLGDNPSGHNYEWVDQNVETGVNYSYTLSAVDLQGVNRTLATTSATPSAGAASVTEYALYQNYPNPFNPTTRISFDLVESGFVSLKIFNPIGQEVATVINGTVEKGHQSVSFDATNLPAGMYIYRISTTGFTAAKKMLLIK